MKCRVTDLVALCPNAGTATGMALGYVDKYNNEMYQDKLAGLTPAEYHAYVTTGIYPCDSYFGVEATEPMPIGALVEARLARERAREESARFAGVGGCVRPTDPGLPHGLRGLLEQLGCSIGPITTERCWDGGALVRE